MAPRLEAIKKYHDHATNCHLESRTTVERIDDLRNQAMLFKIMLLGEPTDKAPWTEADKRIAAILDEAMLDLEDAVRDVLMGRLKSAMIALRCFLEQAFFALYYSEQGLDFTVWQRNPSHFVMLHQLLENSHVFAKHFSTIFRERRDPEWKQRKVPGTFTNRLFSTLVTLYSQLSASVHGRPKQRTADPDKISSAELDLFCSRLRVAIALTTEFFDAAGTGDICPVKPEYRFTPEMVLE